MIASVVSFLIWDLQYSHDVRTYVSIMRRNVAVMSRSNVASMMRIHTPSYIVVFHFFSIVSVVHVGF